jgi:hypothetical protein
MKDLCLFANGKTAPAFNNIIDFVISLVIVKSLSLSRFQAVDVAEHSRTLEKINFLHFFGTEAKDFGNSFHIHILILAQIVTLFTERGTQPETVGDYGDAAEGHGKGS